MDTIITIILAIIGSGLLNVVISNLFYSSKLKKENSHKVAYKHAQEIEESIQAFRDLELKLSEIEIYDIENLLKQESNINMFGGNAIYPAILNDVYSLNEYRDKIRECRKKHEKNLNCLLALNLVFLDRYINQLGLFISSHDADYHTWGTIFIFDLQTWQKKIDRIIMKQLNSYDYKLESHESKKWKKLRKKEVEEQYNSTILCFLSTGKCNKKDKKRLSKMKEYIQLIFDGTSLNVT